jgi:hypothetical protein
MPSYPKKDLDEVLEAIKDSDGIKTVIAARLGVTRQTVDSYLQRWKTAQEAYDIEEESTLDLAESIITTNLRNLVKVQKQAEEDGKPFAGVVNSGDAWQMLKTKGKSRGYVDRQELTGAEGKDLAITYIAENRTNDD